ncbi:hypothetical protein DFJ74DRAFT_676091 [Hyaloraphidium curvatum]|nr:hypothetical protein DFJ74DRAFT_676091 [Hyaloraphidium curvatum]
MVEALLPAPRRAGMDRAALPRCWLYADTAIAGGRSEQCPDGSQMSSSAAGIRFAYPGYLRKEPSWTPKRRQHARHPPPCLPPCPPPAMSSRADVRIAVVGAGVCAVSVFRRLRLAGFASVRVFERSDATGGTWHDARYPGVGLDNEAHTYTFEWAPHAGWSRKFAPGEEVREYVGMVAREVGFEAAVETGKRVAAATWDGARNLWVLDVQHVRTEFVDGFGRPVTGSERKGIPVIVPTGTAEKVEAEWLVRCTGFVNEPAWPELPNIEGFKGRKMHSARWDTTWDHTVPADPASGVTHVVLVGTGSSSVQILPSLARHPHNRITVLQRTSTPYVPRGGNPEYTPAQRARFASDPAALEAHRQSLLRGFSSTLEPAFRKNSVQQFVVSRVSDWSLWWSLKSRKDYEALRFPFPFACKRPCPTDDFAQCFNQPNVELRVASIKRMSERTVHLSDGTEVPCDVLVLCTGYNVTMLPPFPQRGLDGVLLSDAWQGGRRNTHLYSVCTSTQPNSFATWTCHSPIYPVCYGVEVQAAYLVRMLEKAAGMREPGGPLPSIRPRPEAEEQYMRWLAEGLKGYVFTAGCTSWFNQRDPTMMPSAGYPGTFKEYAASLERETDWGREYVVELPGGVEIPAGGAQARGRL